MNECNDAVLYDMKFRIQNLHKVHNVVADFKQIWSHLEKHVIPTILPMQPDLVWSATILHSLKSCTNKYIRSYLSLYAYKYSHLQLQKTVLREWQYSFLLSRPN